MKYFLDSNVFMYAAGREHPLKDPCARVLRRVAQEDMEAVTNVEVLQELLYRYSALGRTDESLRLTRLAVDQVARAVLPVTSGDVERALELIQRYGGRIGTRDAVHAATMLNNGLTHIVSADAHFDEIKEVVRVDPRELA